MILGSSGNGMGIASIAGSYSRLPGTSTIGIPDPANSKSIALAWRAFTSVAYGKNRSLVGGLSAKEGDDVMTARMDGKDYDVEEYVIKGAEVLAVIK
jgi:co-chaperonin GroES (HSP10)